MYKFLAQNYKWITLGDLLLACGFFLVNLYLYPHLPAQIPTSYGLLGPSVGAGLGGKITLWVFPFILFLLAFIFSEGRQWGRFPMLSVNYVLWNNTMGRLVFIGAQVVVWVAMFFAYWYLFSLIKH